MQWLKDNVSKLTAQALMVLVRGLTGVRAEWRAPPQRGPRVYFANHGSHADALLIWAVLPPALRARTRPVAAVDYWLARGPRRFLARTVFRSVFVERTRRERSADAIAVMSAALQAGDSLILFPEGTRNTSDAALLSFRSGLSRLVERNPRVECVPVWIENLNRVLPKGEFIPLPLLCAVTFGCPITLRAGESQSQFLDRARRALLDLAPQQGLDEKCLPI